MSHLLQIQEQILDTGSQIAELERSLAEGYSWDIALSLKSMYKMRDRLEAELREVARSSQVDVFSYRLFDGRERPTMMQLGRAMESFQKLYAIIYAAVASRRRKDTSKLSADAIRNSAFEFSHAFAGSVGFVFTMPNERLLVGETKLDRAMEDLFSIARSSTADEIKAFSRTFGLAPVRAAYSWADALSKGGYGVDIKWRKNDDAKRATLQPPEVAALRDLIGLTSDVEEDENTYEGTLLGFDSSARTFRFDPSDGGAVIRGSVAETASVPTPVSIPKRYAALVRTTSRVHYATEKQDLSYELLALVERG